MVPRRLIIQPPGMGKRLGTNSFHRVRQYHVIQIITKIKRCIVNRRYTFRNRNGPERTSGKSKTSDLCSTFRDRNCADRLVTIIHPFRNLAVLCLSCDILFFTGLLSRFRFRIPLLYLFLTRMHLYLVMIPYNNSSAQDISGNRCCNRCRRSR